MVKVTDEMVDAADDARSIRHPRTFRLPAGTGRPLLQLLSADLKDGDLT